MQTEDKKSEGEVLLRLMSRETECKSIYGAESFAVHQPARRAGQEQCVRGLGMRGFKRERLLMLPGEEC